MQDSRERQCCRLLLWLVQEPHNFFQTGEMLGEAIKFGHDSWPDFSQSNLQANSNFRSREAGDKQSRQATQLVGFRSVSCETRVWGPAHIQQQLTRKDMTNTVRCNCISAHVPGIFMVLVDRCLASSGQPTPTEMLKGVRNYCFFVVAGLYT